ncbi:putative ribonuclease H-like domain-containing protein [Tanacetum coccineum]
MIKKGEYDLWSMKMRQYIAITDHILWDIITNGDQATTDPASSHLLSFHDATDAKTLWSAIKARFGGNEASKKMQKNLLKQQFETFTIGSREELDSAYERFQNILSMLELYDAKVSNEDANLKFLRSLPSVWHVVATMIRGQPGLDELEFDDLYNNLKVYEHELKGVSNSSSQNIAFLSTEVKGSTLKQSTADPANIPKGYTQAPSSKVQTAPNCASHSDEIICPFFAQQASMPTTHDDEDMLQIDKDAMEEINIRWQVAMITARIRKFMRKTGRPIDLKPKNGITFDKSKIECFNCQKLGHFARECRFAKYQENRANGRNEKKIVAIEDSNSKALVATDNNEEVDWTKEFDDEPVTFAMMALTELEEDDWSMEIDAESVHFGQDGLGDFDWSNKADDTPVSLALMATNTREEKQKELDQVLKERDDFKVKLEKWTNASVLQNEVLNKQRYLSDKSCIGFGIESSSSVDSDNSSGNTNSTEFLYSNFQKAKGFHAVPPPTGTVIPPRANVSFTGIDELAIRNKVINQEKTKSSQPEIDRNKVIIEDWVDSDDEETDLNFLEIQKKTVVNSENSETSFENRSPNSQTSVGQGSRKKGLEHKGGKTCFVCYSPDHLIKAMTYTKKNLQTNPKTHKPKDRRGSRDTRQFWNNINRVNHSNFSGNSRYSTTRTPHRPQRPKKIMKSIWVKKESTVGSQTVLPKIGQGQAIDFKEFKGGYVAFGNDPKGGRITGKGTITRILPIIAEYIGHNVLFTDKECLILSPKFKFVDEDLVILRAPRKNDVYSLDLKNIIPSGGVTCLVAKATKDEAVLWHRRLGHVNFKNINKLVKGNLVRGLPSKTFKLDHSCLACRKGKQHRASCKKIEERTVREPLELLHMDLFGPVSVESVNRKKYCLVVTDDCSKFSWVFFLAYKDETYDMLHDLIVGLENKLRHKVKTIRCDHGTEFKNHLMNEFCAKKGIKREYSIARTPQQNGVAERKNRTLIEAARTMLADSLLPIQFWAEAVNNLNISFMRPFVCPLTILNTLDQLGKFDGKSEEGYLLGYSTNSKGFRVYNRVTRKVQDCLHVNFLENQENQKGKGPDWMFDLELLSPSMNYIPVRKENYADSGGQATTYDDVEDLDDQQFIVHGPSINTVQSKHSEERTADKEVPLSSEEQAQHDELVSLMHQESIAKVHNDAQRNAFEKEKRRIALEKGKECDSDDDVPKDGVFSTNSFDDENKEDGEPDYNNMDHTIDVTSTPTLQMQYESSSESDLL